MEKSVCGLIEGGEISAPAEMVDSILDSLASDEALVGLAQGSPGDPKISVDLGPDLKEGGKAFSAMAK